jgi:hypothetical protein
MPLEGKRLRANTVTTEDPARAAAVLSSSENFAIAEDAILRSFETRSSSCGWEIFYASAERLGGN